MLLNPWKVRKVMSHLFNRIAELNTELRNTKACLEAERNLGAARLKMNQHLVKIILESDRADDFSVSDLSML
jgi:hypothetical protein